MKKPEKSLVDKLRLPVCLHSKTGLCKHPFGCTENAVRGFYRMFWITFAFKTALGNLMLLVKPAKLIKSLLKGKNHLDSLKFALFISLLNSIYKSVLCIMRRFSLNDKLNAAIAGALSAISLLVDEKQRRVFFALVLFSRALDTFLNFLQKRGLFYKFNHGEVLCWALMGCFNKYLMSFEPECLAPSFRGFYFKYSAMTRNDSDFCGLWVQRMENGYA